MLDAGRQDTGVLWDREALLRRTSQGFHPGRSRSGEVRKRRRGGKTTYLNGKHRLLPVTVLPVFERSVLIMHSFS